MQKKALYIGIAVVVVIAGAATYHRSQRNAELRRQSHVKEEGLVTVTVATVESRAFSPSIPFTGNLLAMNRADLRAEVPGRVTHVHVQEGDTVKAGAVLSTQDEDDLALAAQAAEAQLAQAQAQALQAKRDAARAEMLLEKRSITRQAAQVAETANNAAAAAVQAAESQAGMAKVRMKKARILAPFDGQVARRMVQAGDVLMAGQSVFEVVDNRKLEIQADLPANAMALVKPGQSVSFRVPGFQQPFTGTLTQVSPILSPDGRNLHVRMEVPNTDRQLKSGVFVEGLILGNGQVQRASLPTSLLKVEGQNGDLYVVENGVAKKRSVLVGAEQDGYRPLDGISVGTKVVATGQDLVREGSRLQIVAGEANAAPKSAVKPEGK
ncbi:MAG: efflux RND transporter periplasmic adaptor subunit [Holophagaceae bacterium]|nr:efflux RND transporter periplasmic adaptor subunit [Holophagaceae bacterium]